MLAYIKGELAVKARGYVVIDVGGLGYKVFMSELAMENVGNIGEIVKVRITDSTSATLLGEIVWRNMIIW